MSVFAFAFFGANAGIKQKFTLLGILTCAFLPALGGGTIREILLGHPPIYFDNYAYGLVVIFAVIFALVTKRFQKVTKYMYILDALGMAIFAYLGAMAALQAQLGLGGSIIFALLTACGGGILCDLLTRQTPHAFRYRYYALPPLFLGASLWAIDIIHGPAFASSFLLLGAFILQASIAYPRLPKQLFDILIKKTNVGLKILRQSLSLTSRS